MIKFFRLSKDKCQHAKNPSLDLDLGQNPDRPANLVKVQLAANVTTALGSKVPPNTRRIAAKVRNHPENAAQVAARNGADRHLHDVGVRLRVTVLCITENAK